MRIPIRQEVIASQGRSGATGKVWTMTCRTSFLIERLTTHGLLVGVDAVVDGLCSLYSERNRSGEQESSHNFYDRHAVNLAELGAYRQLQFQRSADPSLFGRRFYERGCQERYSSADRPRVA